MSLEMPVQHTEETLSKLKKMAGFESMDYDPTVSCLFHSGLGVHLVGLVSIVIVHIAFMACWAGIYCGCAHCFHAWKY